MEYQASGWGRLQNKRLHVEKIKKRGAITAPKYAQTWLSPVRTRHGAGTQLLHVFINKTADGEELTQKTVWPGLFDCSSPLPPLEANPRRQRARGRARGRAAALPGALAPGAPQPLSSLGARGGSQGARQNSLNHSTRPRLLVFHTELLPIHH